MKNYLYHFEFFSGFYESYFYQQVKAKNEKDAIIQIVGYFKNITEEDVEKFLNKELQNKWTTKTFWDKIDLRFSNDSEGYTLIWIKEIDFDLNNVGKII
ncbi:MAG TPA: hypothetical protein VF571_04995 [Pyrinomonadaceae bacterium]|jgi:CTP:phosphocholine cytidylyltransferase-like protein